MFSLTSVYFNELGRCFELLRCDLTDLADNSQLYEENKYPMLYDVSLVAITNNKREKELKM